MDSVSWTLVHGEVIINLLQLEQLTLRSNHWSFKVVEDRKSSNRPTFARLEVNYLAEMKGFLKKKKPSGSEGDCLCVD